MSLCDDQKAALVNQWHELSNAIIDKYNEVQNELTLLIALKNKFCDPNDPDYNPICCSVFASRVSGFPADLLSRRDQAIQFAYDAIYAIQCSSQNWITQMKEALNQMKNLYDFLEGLNTLDVLLTGYLTDISCAQTVHPVPGGD